ncbi:hypothetical protein ACI2UZ_01780 [Ralstonia nicotianae]|nr:hypothetical protein [Ralstonia solanacearum]
MKNTPQEKTLRNPNYSTGHMQTAADFKAWYVANNAAIKAEQTRMRTLAAEKALSYLQSRVRFGASIQDAGDGYFRDCVRPKYWPAVYSEVARELFSQLGWVDRKGAK